MIPKFLLRIYIADSTMMFFRQLMKINGLKDRILKTLSQLSATAFGAEKIEDR